MSEVSVSAIRQELDAIDPKISRVDAHAHAWKAENLPRVVNTPEVRSARKDLLADTHPHSVIARANHSGIGHVLFVQARDPDDDGLGEARWLSEIYGFTRGMAGFVAGIDLTKGEGVAADLDVLCALPGLKGVRMIAPENETAVPGIYSTPAALEAAKVILGRKLTLDVLFRSGVGNQLAEVQQFLLKLTDQAQGSIVIDHLGKPPGVMTGTVDPKWRAAMRVLGERKEIFVKLSALRGEAGLKAPRVRFFDFYNLALEAFGERRLLAGSDHPVSGEYGECIRDLFEWVKSRKQSGREFANNFFQANAVRAYNLDLHRL